MKILFFDTETTGLPKNWKAPMADLDNWPRVIQLAWVVANDKGNVLRRQVHLIIPTDWIMPTEEFWAKHGYDHQKSSINGVLMSHALDMFLWDLSECDAIVSHNFDFDHNVLGAEMIRHSRKLFTAKPKQYCTKIIGTDVCRLPGNYGSYKWPKLEELHRFLFDKDFEGAHDALNDVMACKDYFFEMTKRNVIIIKGEKVNGQTILIAESDQNQ